MPRIIQNLNVTKLVVLVDSGKATAVLDFATCSTLISMVNKLSQHCNAYHFKPTYHSRNICVSNELLT